MSTTIIAVPNGKIEACPKCGAAKDRIHRDPYRVPVVLGIQCKGLYTCFSCETQYTEAPPGAVVDGGEAPAPERPAVEPESQIRFPGSPAAPSSEKPTRSILEETIRAYETETDESGLAGKIEGMALRMGRLRADMELIGFEVGVAIDTPQFANAVIAAIRSGRRQPTGMRKVYDAAKRLMAFLGKNTGANEDWPVKITADEDHAGRLRKLLQDLDDALKKK